MENQEPKYRIIAGEGERGSVEGFANTERGARRAASIAACHGDRWAHIQMIAASGEWETVEKWPEWVNR